MPLCVYVLAFVHLHARTPFPISYLPFRLRLSTCFWNWHKPKCVMEQPHVKVEVQDVTISDLIIIIYRAGFLGKINILIQISTIPSHNTPLFLSWETRWVLWLTWKSQKFLGAKGAENVIFERFSSFKTPIFFGLRPIFFVENSVFFYYFFTKPDFFCKITQKCLKAFNQMWNFQISLKSYTQKKNWEYFFRISTKPENIFFGPK